MPVVVVVQGKTMEGQELTVVEMVETKRIIPVVLDSPRQEHLILARAVVGTTTPQGVREVQALSLSQHLLVQ